MTDDSANSFAMYYFSHVVAYNCNLRLKIKGFVLQCIYIYIYIDRNGKIRHRSVRYKFVYNKNKKLTDYASVFFFNSS